MKDLAPPVTPETLLSAYMAGVFPMAETRDDSELFWVEPNWRGVLPLDGFRLSRSLAKRMRRGDLETSWNVDFAGVLDACAARDETWISDRLAALYLELHAAGFAHSQEVWSEGRLIGGVYGIALGGAFFGESMFSAGRDGSKIALAVLVHRLRRAGFALFDTQFVTPHLMSLGVQEIDKAEYRRRLAGAIRLKPGPLAPEPDLQDVVQRRIQMS
ncbi:MAG: leucyl/phenylalanyl-tRNA--protein transferase [Hasllibacter sp.]